VTELVAGCQYLAREVNLLSHFLALVLGDQILNERILQLLGRQKHLHILVDFFFANKQFCVYARQVMTFVAHSEALKFLLVQSERSVVPIFELQITGVDSRGIVVCQRDLTCVDRLIISEVGEQYCHLTGDEIYVHRSYDVIVVARRVQLDLILLRTGASKRLLRLVPQQISKECVLIVAHYALEVDLLVLVHHG
jgi:hypothetical protein